MQKLKVTKDLKKAAASFVKAKAEAKEATNLTGREKTVLRNAIIDYWTTNKLPIGSYMRMGGSEFRYEAAASTAYDTDAILQLYDDEEITRDQFLLIMKVDPKQLGNVLGGDQAADLSTTTLGDKLDVRINDLPVEQDDDEFIMVERNVRKKKKRSVFGKRADVKAQASQPKRRIKIKSRRST